ncbi:hypothetical protein DFH07DRAFT_834621 [Mycena maculata]|uniref:Sjogrens syndrome scleroderma autoantigen 1 family protein n=1 Tax=Mycena maculata TaxID=230809 RepID=A0AAD7IJH5_9AGAR|nr:hypothetical protein DFH07DRAFT_834621 [Mycena maculata]
MSRDVSEILGQYMLKGWVLTDRRCPTAGCSVPLMRSPTGRTPVVHFCASCDGGPDSIRPQVPDSSASVSSSSHFSRSSTPPTEVSSTLSSPVFAPPPLTEESRRRAEQSDAASSAIGQRLLKGWAMLAEECPNVRCFGVPLVRPPKAGGEKDPRKECVICGTVYITRGERLVPEDFDESTTPVISNKGKAREVEIEVPKSIPETTSAIPQQLVQYAPLNMHTSTPITTSLVRTNSIFSTLDESAQGLESTLRILSGRLTSLTAGQSDPSSIGSVADAISKVVVALSQIRQLQRAEKHSGDVL